MSAVPARTPVVAADGKALLLSVCAGAVVGGVVVIVGDGSTAEGEVVASNVGFGSYEVTVGFGAVIGLGEVDVGFGLGVDV